MNSVLIRDFEESLRDHDVSYTRTTTEEFDTALTDIGREPVVGAPLPFEGVSLGGHATLDPTPRQLREAKTGVTPVTLGIRDYGTVIIQSNEAGNEPVSLFPPRHIAVLCASDIVPGIPEAIDWLSNEVTAGRDSAIFATGPSSTGDMGALVQGVHGPSEVHVLILEDL